MYAHRDDFICRLATTRIILNVCKHQNNLTANGKRQTANGKSLIKIED
jgi:hypothetical protein